MRRRPVVWCVAATCAGLLSGCGSSVTVVDVAAPSPHATSSAPTGGVGATEPVAREDLESLLPTVDDVAATDPGEWQAEGMTENTGVGETTVKASPPKCQRFFDKLRQQTMTSEVSMTADFDRSGQPDRDSLSVTLYAFPQSQVMMSRVDHMDRNWRDCEQYTMVGLDMRLEPLELPARGDGSSTVVVSYRDILLRDRYLVQTYLSLGYVGTYISYASSTRPTQDELLAFQDMVIRKVEQGAGADGAGEEEGE